MRKSSWQIQTAKNRFSELVEKASRGEPQLVTKNNKPIAYVIDVKTYEKKIKGEKKSMKTVLLSRPHKGIEIDMSRDGDSGRDIIL
jgi:prevent-host-death family protein